MDFNSEYGEKHILSKWEDFHRKIHAIFPKSLKDNHLKEKLEEMKKTEMSKGTYC